MLRRFSPGSRRPHSVPYGEVLEDPMTDSSLAEEEEDGIELGAVALAGLTET